MSSTYIFSVIFLFFSFLFLFATYFFSGASLKDACLRKLEEKRNEDEGGNLRGFNVTALMKVSSLLHVSHTKELSKALLAYTRSWIVFRGDSNSVFFLPHTAISPPSRLNRFRQLKPWKAVSLRRAAMEDSDEDAGSDWDTDDSACWFSVILRNLVGYRWTDEPDGYSAVLF